MEYKTGKEMKLYEFHSSAMDGNESSATFFGRFASTK
jgi:hypothetical protein